jgi:hypothetical protein
MELVGRRVSPLTPLWLPETARAGISAHTATAKRPVSPPCLPEFTTCGEPGIIDQFEWALSSVELMTTRRLDQ